jgi:hypothetical protein
MIYVQKIRKLIYNLLNYYELNEIKYNENQQYYFLYKSTLYKTEFECYSAENKIGICSKFNDKKAIICLNLLKMLYDRDYEFLLEVYTYIIDNDIFDEYIKFHKTLDKPKLWTHMLLAYYDDNYINLIKYTEIPKYTKNLKSKFKQTFYYIKDIKINYFQLDKI